MKKNGMITGLFFWLWPSAILFLFLPVIFELFFAPLNLFYLIFISASSAILFSILIFFAIAKIKERENKFIINEKLSRLLIENRKDYGIFMLDPAGKVVSWNKGAQRLIGYNEDEIIGKDFSYFYTPEDQQRDIPNSFLEQAKNKKQIEFEAWHVGKNNKRFWATVTMTAIFNENSQLIGFTKLVRNSTRQKEADEKLKNLIICLERSNEELERFAYIASHDLQEPLRMVSSYVQLLAKKYQNKLDHEADELIHFVVDGVDRMQQLITDLLIYSRVTTQGKPLTLISSKEIVENAIRNLYLAIQEKSVEITYDLLPMIMGDAVQLLQVFQNLIGNAIKFNNSNMPKIHIGAKQDGNKYIFCIEDNGIGIAPENHEKIFLIFQRLHSKKEYAGTGVGLAICKKIVDRHGGRLWVESELGKGAKFCFTLAA